MSTEISRLYNFVNDKNAGVPITASRVDAEFNAIIASLNQKVIIKSTAPSSPIAGILWLDSTNKLLKQYRNAEWVGAGCVHIGTAAPATIQEGDLWYDTTNNVLKSYDGAAWGNLPGMPNGTQGAIPYYSGSASFGTVYPSLGLPLVSQGFATAPQFMRVESDGVGTLATANYGSNSVNSTALKTTTGEVSTPANTPANLTLPGGEYGFYPQFKAATAGAAAQYRLATDWTEPATYTTNIHFYNASYISYAQQRYITASGKDHWLFLLVDKETKDIAGSWSAPDHPAYGNGGDFEKLPQPFLNYDKTKHEIVLVDNDTIAELKAQVTNERSLLTIVNEEYKVDIIEQIYKPLHSGRFLDKEPELVQTIPDYIKVRKLIKLNQIELDKKVQKEELTRQKIEQDKIKKKQDKQSARNKLLVLGLTEIEIDVLKE